MALSGITGGGIMPPVQANQHTKTNQVKDVICCEL